MGILASVAAAASDVRGEFVMGVDTHLHASGPAGNLRVAPRCYGSAPPGLAMDFPIRITPLLTPLLWPFGVRGPKAVATVEGGQLRLQFGALFDHTFPLAQVEHVSRSSWPWWMGMGLRIGLDKKLGLIGGLEGIVCVHFRESLRMQSLVPLKCRDIYVSFEDPDGFIQAVEAAMAATSSSQPAE